MKTPCSRNARYRRAGLAPLELVLSLPIMLFVMALMINFGTVASWKVRTQANARQAGWRTLELRTGQGDAHPAGWPQAASLGSGSGTPAVAVNDYWDGHPDLNRGNGSAGQVVRGPVMMAADPQTGAVGRIAVRRDLEMSRGVHNGNARIRREFPLLRGVTRDGSYRFDLDQNLLDRRWEYHDLGYGSNDSRRAKRWYHLEPQDYPELAGLLTQVRTAHAQLRQNPTRFDLDPLDRDDEFFRYRGSAPDFHPTIGGMCVHDVTLVAASPQYASLLDRIERLPGRMGRAFRSLYQSEIDRLEAMMPQPPGAAALIAELQMKVDQLDTFLGGLPPQHR